MMHKNSKKKLEIEYLPISDIKPYDKNARKHTDEDVDTIIHSIQDFGMNDPIGIWGDDNVIVEGHGRYMACKKLGVTEVPTITLDHLDDEQRRAYALAHNKTAEMSDWDFDILKLEIENILEYNVEDYGFDILDEDYHEEQAEKTQKRVEDIENLSIAQYNGTGYYDIPAIKPVYDIPPIEEWIGFNYALTATEPEKKGVHFFIDDYQFERIWNNPEKYVDVLKQFACVAAPDFSPYGDMPLALQIYNHYRKHWVACYLQENGVTVIPTIRASTDRRSFDWYLDGEPKNGVVMISSMWTGKEDMNEIFKEEYSTMYETLKPSLVLMYGKRPKGIKGNIQELKTFTDKRWN